MRSLMLLGMTVGLCLAALATLAVDSRLSRRNAGPMLVLDETQLDMGVVVAGVPLQVSFPVRNDGGQRVVIHADPSVGGCACEARQSLILPPDQTGQLSAALSTTDAAGVTIWHIPFVSSDPENPRFTFTVRAQVQTSERTPTPAAEEAAITD